MVALLTAALVGASEAQAESSPRFGWQVSGAVGQAASDRDLDEDTSRLGSLRFLIAANERQRFGLELASIDAERGGGLDIRYTAVGIVLETRVRQCFFASIGALGYFGSGDNEDNPFGIASMWGWEANPDKRQKLFVALRSDVIFDDPTTRLFSLAVGLRF
ncbi:MAG: hypothetical protein AAGD01_16315 [Acidobacteriota bacterium]